MPHTKQRKAEDDVKVDQKKVRGENGEAMPVKNETNKTDGVDTNQVILLFLAFFIFYVITFYWGLHSVSCLFVTRIQFS